MFYWIYDIPHWQLAILISSVFVLFSWVGCIFVRPFVRLFVRSKNGSNDLVGYILSCFCVFYGLLLGLIAVASYQNRTAIETNVSREVVTLTALYQDTKGYPEPYSQNLRWLLRDYCRYVIKYAWPLQRQGIIPEGGRMRVIAFQEKLLAFEPQTKAQEIIHAETLRQFNIFFDARRTRIHSVTTSIPSVMWYVVLLGAVLNISIVWMFEMRLVTQLALGGVLAFFLGAMIFLIAVLDNPFRGDLGVDSDGFERIHALMLDEATYP